MTTEQLKPRKLLDHVRDTLRVKRYSIRNEKTCVSWIRRYILFHDKRHPEEMGRLPSKPQIPPRLGLCSKSGFTDSFQIKGFGF